MPHDQRILDALRHIIDPELGINIVDLGLVYEASREDNAICVRLTTTTPTCPIGAYIHRQVEQTLHNAFGDATSITVSLVWDPPWTPHRMTPEARRQLGWQT